MAGFDRPVAIIGAGPFGVSTATRLRSRGVNFRICGSPMNRGRTQMPAGILKSERFASSLADPTVHHALQQSCQQAARGVSCSELDRPGSTDFCCGGGLK
jgi:2-polyprenyl-6-methoxyphenol hydroxylase-like FAD-dependent oxidoreductase